VFLWLSTSELLLLPRVQHPFYEALVEPDHADDLQVKVVDTEPQLYK